MRALILVALLACAFAVRVPKNNVNKMVEELQKTKFGSTLLHMVQLHSKAQGPVQELEDAIEELINDLTEELTELDEEFRERTAEHNGDVIQYEQEIQSASLDIARTEDTVNSLLAPRQAQLEDRLEQVEQNAADNRQTLEEDTLVRAQEHEAYEQQVEELNGATESVDEALELLASLANPNLLQVKKFQNSLKKIEAKISKRGHLSPLIKALVSLASNQNFADQDSLRGIVDALNEFRVAVVDSLNDLTLSEQQDVEDFEERVVQLNLEYAEFQSQVNNLNFDLTTVQTKIVDMNEFAAQRTADEAAFQELLELENTTYAEETQIYTDLKNEYLAELGVAEQALGLVQNADFGNINV